MRRISMLLLVVALAVSVGVLASGCKEKSKPAKTTTAAPAEHKTMMDNARGTAQNAVNSAGNAANEAATQASGAAAGAQKQLETVPPVEPVHDHDACQVIFAYG